MIDQTKVQNFLVVGHETTWYERVPSECIVHHAQTPEKSRAQRDSKKE